jgi:hypothetical protein
VSVAVPHTPGGGDEHCVSGTDVQLPAPSV